MKLLQLFLCTSLLIPFYSQAMGYDSDEDRDLARALQMSLEIEGDASSEKLFRYHWSRQLAEVGKFKTSLHKISSGFKGNDPKFNDFLEEFEAEGQKTLKDYEARITADLTSAMSEMHASGNADKLPRDLFDPKGKGPASDFKGNDLKLDEFSEYEAEGLDTLDAFEARITADLTAVMMEMHASGDADKLQPDLFDPKGKGPASEDVALALRLQAEEDAELARALAMSLHDQEEPCQIFGSEFEGFEAPNSSQLQDLHESVAAHRLPGNADELSRQAEVEATCFKIMREINSTDCDFDLKGKAPAIEEGDEDFRSRLHPVYPDSGMFKKFEKNKED